MVYCPSKAKTGTFLSKANMVPVSMRFILNDIETIPYHSLQKQEHRLAKPTYKLYTTKTTDLNLYI